MELLIAAAGAAGILALIAFLSPAVERERKPIHTMVGRDQHVRRVQRASLAAQVTQRNAPRPLRVTGESIRRIQAPAAVPVMPGVPVVAAMPPIQLPPPAMVAPRLDWARQTSESQGLNQREHNADGLVASLLGPGAHA